MAGVTTFKDELLAFYEKCYYYEMDRKDKIRQQLGLAIAVLALLGNSASYYFSNFQFLPFRFSHLWFYVPFTVSAFLALIAFMYLIRYMFIPEGGYAYIPTTEAIRVAINDFENANQSTSENVIRDFYTENLSKQYSEFATHNRRNNTRRTGYVFSSLRSSLISIFFLILAFPGFLYFKREFPLHTSKPAERSIMSEQQVRPDDPNNSDANASEDQQGNILEPAVTASPDTSIIPVQWPQGEFIKEADEKKAK